MSIIYATRSTKLVHNALKSWIEELRSLEFVDDVVDEYWDRMFQSYVDVIQVFGIVEKTHHRLVLLYIIHTSSNTLLDIWLRIDLRAAATDSNDFQYAFFTCLCLTWTVKNLVLLLSLSLATEKFYSGMTEVQNTCIKIITSKRCSVISQMWLVKNTTLQILLCIESEKFYATMTEVQSVCALLKSGGCTDKQRRICKNIQRQQVASFRKLNVFGLLVIDATLLYQIYNVVTTYTLTLLQFDLS
ncbi:hypothetical protein PYW07_009317 [Mythimna separata]|uniref:Uncharacterized protein n=1 Tax=Mythimna separata TaxID=271217 RepID=A0AAD7YCA8_MYTSE|nr:hypothetical protein PYW07_009317 [Mythimna separata]